MAINEHQRQKRNRRTTDRKRAPDLHRQQGGRCFWCGADVVIVRSIEKDQRRSMNHEALTLTNGSTVLIATVDHLDGVLHRRKKKRLVVSCAPCNRARAQAEQMFAKFVHDRCQSLSSEPSCGARELMKVPAKNVATQRPAQRTKKPACLHRRVQTVSQG